MHLGVQVRATAEGVDLRWIARELEARGVESLFLPEHTHLPVEQQSVHPGGEALMEPAMRGLDPFVGLAFAAAATERLRVGTGVCLLPQHDPIILAKVVSTLDVLSGGRVLLGIGAGWNREEMANHGVAPEHRWAIMREKALAMRRIWTEAEAAFAGEWVRFGPIRQWPKPAQQPHPPVLVGGEGSGVLRRVVEYGDGWLPNDHAEVLDRAISLDRLAAEAGRGPLPVTVYAMPWDGDRIARYAAHGIARCVLDLPSRQRDETARALDRLADLVRRASA
jgi:probable F420-dependent oxidoreductase